MDELMLPIGMGLRAQSLANTALLPIVVICALSARVTADVINIENWQQNSTLSSNIFSASDFGNYGSDTRYLSNPTDATLNTITQNPIQASVSATVDGRTASGSANQTVNSFQLDRSKSLSLNYQGSTQASIQDAYGVDDRVSVTDYFHIQFTTDREMHLTLSAMGSATGSPISEKFPNNALHFALKSTGAANGFQDIEFFVPTNSNTPVTEQAPEGAMLPAGSYQLSFENDYNIGDSSNVQGSNYSAGTSYSVNFAISAVPEPGSIACLLFSTCCIGFRRRR
ncbi:MAG: hypothetical protein Aurels2KO_37030 [Aureliella sp.]